MMSKYHCNLLPDKIYHIFSRAVGNEKLFLSPENYRFFLSKFDKYISPVAEVYCWALLPNHFHFMIKVKSADELHTHYKGLSKKEPLRPELYSKFVMQCFSNLLNSYTKSFNKLYSRKGALFMDYLRRVEIESDAQFCATAFYIHKNPVHHGYCLKMQDWNWSSYHSYLTRTPSQPATIELLEYFGGPEGFKRYQSQIIYLKEQEAIEED